MWGGKKISQTKFSPVTSTNVGISPNNSLNLGFNTFATLLYNLHVIPSTSPKLLHLNQEHPAKNVVFLVKSL